MSATIRPYRPGDEAGLVTLFAQAFGRPMDEAHWRWKLAGGASALAAPRVFVGVLTAPAGRERIVHQFAGIPVRYAGPAGRVTGIVAVDAMTAPEFRRRGLLTAASREAWRCWREVGIAFVVGLPNEQWGSRTRALGWRALGPLAWRVRPVRLDRLARRRFGLLAGRLAVPVGLVWDAAWNRRSSADRTVAISRVRNAEDFDRLWFNLERGRRPRTTYSVVRDRAWIEWRYLSAPEEEYAVWLAERSGEPVGHIVTRLREAGGRRIGYIAELAAVDDAPAVQRALLADAVAFLGAEGAELVASLAVPGTPLDRALRRAGFLFSWGQFSLQMVPLQSESLVPLSGVCGGDFDVV